MRHFRHKDYRNAVLDAVISVLDKIRAKTGLKMDGDDLCNRAFSPNSPILLVADVSTESGRSDQLGFMLLCKGAYQSIRNPKAQQLSTLFSRAS